MEHAGCEREKEKLYFFSPPLLNINTRGSVQMFVSERVCVCVRKKWIFASRLATCVTWGLKKGEFLGEKLEEGKTSQPDK